MGTSRGGAAARKLKTQAKIWHDSADALRLAADYADARGDLALGIALRAEAAYWDGLAYEYDLAAAAAEFAGL